MYFLQYPSPNNIATHRRSMRFRLNLDLHQVKARQYINLGNIRRGLDDADTHSLLLSITLGLSPFHNSDAGC